MIWIQKSILTNTVAKPWTEDTEVTKALTNAVATVNLDIPLVKTDSKKTSNSKGDKKH